jgi:hypothetical protein
LSAERAPAVAGAAICSAFASECEECKKQGWPALHERLCGINGRSLCWSHASTEVPGIPKTTITAN